ncbi:MAG: hypothetical protein H7Y06_05385 [Opitutaceae bacterium]|nr:hypothetical protein [Opitutaceae bacterium]
MKILNYTLAVTAGAFVAYLAMRQGVDTREGAMTEPASVIVAKPEVVLAGPSMEEMAKLEKENAELGVRLEETRTQLAEREVALVKTKEALEELRRPMTEDILSSSLRAEMKSGEAIVTGGYRLPDGKRLYAFATPVLDVAGGTDAVLIESRYLAVTDAAGATVGLDSLATNADNTLQHGEVWLAEEQREVMGKLVGSEGVDLVVYPSVRVQPGGSALVEVGGITLKVTPELAKGGDGLNVELRLEQPSVKPVP